MSQYNREQADFQLKALQQAGWRVKDIQSYIFILEGENAALIKASGQVKESSTSECTCGKRKSSGITYPGYE